MPATSKSLPWAAEWRVSSSLTNYYNGSGKVWSDNLETSVSTNPGGENPFRVIHRTLVGSVGSYSGSGKGKRFTQPGPSDFGDAILPSAPIPAFDAANLWARTNPSRPAILLPVFWIELREVPDLIRQAGRFLRTARRNWPGLIRPGKETRDLATANLAVQFGWAPLLRDLHNIARFQSLVDKRKKEIVDATAEGGYRRMIGNGGSSLSFTGSRFANFGNYRNFSVSYSGSSHAKQWAVMKWRPTTPGVDILPSSDAELRRQLTGMTLSHALTNAWEALPWSWLVDYFTNIGDVIQAGNRHYATPAGGSVMTTITTTASHPSYTSGVDVLSPGALTIVEKARSPANGATITASIPTLGGGQLSILSSLAVLKFRKTLGS